MFAQHFLIGITCGYLVASLLNHSAIADAADTYSCYHCENEDCEDPLIAECKIVAAAENYKCFIRFDRSNNDIVEMGCLSDRFLDNNIQELIKNKTLYVCDGVNCNDFAKLSKSIPCSKCSSSNETACATRPTTINMVQTCNNIPYTQCYQRVKGQVTERGCLNDLEGDEFYDCLTGGDEKCQICHSKNCNEDIIPSDRKRCHLCSSETDVTCERSPAALSVCLLYNKTDNCVAIYDNGITKRGCQSELVCDANLKNCQVCSTDGCNTANIKRRFDDIYGVFQDLPLNCNTCSGDGCQPGKPFFPNSCQDEDYQDCMTVFDVNGKVIRRGCENLVLAEQQSHCESHPELCFTCKANGCNNMTDHLTYQECLYCDATANPDCLLNPNSINTTRKCSLGCVTSLYPRKSNPKVLDFVRTCFEDIETDNHGSCTAENNCIKCSGNRCNNVTLPEGAGRRSCLHCEGSNCDRPTSKPCIGYNPNDMCYIYFDNVTLSPVGMGCRSSLADDKLRKEIKQYYICDGDDCNDHSKLPEATFCLDCDSENDVNCAISPSKLVERSKCDILPYTECFTRIRDGGYTQRGCLSKLPTDAFITCNDGHPDSMCRICTDHNCNANMFPGYRHWCHRCNSTTDGNCEYSPTVRQYCPRYQVDDACVTQYINGITRRDCASEITCDGLGYKNCRKCSHYGCNNVILSNEDIGALDIFLPYPPTCHKCTGKDCENFIIPLSSCEGNANQPCTTAFNASGAVIARGCSDSLENICSHEGNTCFNCKSTACNMAKKLTDYIDCIHCDARNGDDCVFNVNAIKRTRKCNKSCITALYARTKDENPAYELIRTCLDDKGMSDMYDCEISADPTCISCTSKNCNKDDLGSRKTCYQCRGDDCRSPKSQTCRATMNNDQCFQQWDESGTLLEMGCKSKYDPPEVELLVKRKYLWLCDDDNCNHVDNSPKPNTCVICNSKTNAKCATQPNTVLASTTCSKMPYTQCYSRVLENGHTERGCLSNLEDTEFLDCLYNRNSTSCFSCTGNKCNQEIYPKNRLSCHACSSVSSAECESTPDAAQVCLLYSPNDKCTTLIDIDGNTVRGCGLKVNCSAANTTVCQECVGDSCNFENLKRKADGKPGQWQYLPLTCLTCNNSEECSAGSDQQICNSSEYCMTVFDTSGRVIKRGCSDGIEKDLGTYCDSHSSNCLNCNSNLCNKAAGLNNYIDCIYCDSKTNPDCVFNPLAVKYQRKCNGFCMTALYPTANNYSYELVRTCLDDKDHADQSACSNGSSQECKSCSTTACNIHKLPGTRFSCYHCQGENCDDAQQSECAKYKADEQCFIQFNNVSDIVRMGCLSDLEENFVSSNLHMLYICNSNDSCNSYKNIPKPTLCTVCKSNNDTECATNPSNVPQFATCSSLPNTQCYTKVNRDGSTHRGCVNSLTPTEIIACLGGTDTNCSICASGGCNTEIFPVNRRSCQRCNTKDNPKCESSPNFASICPVYEEDQFCVTKLVNGHTYRDCSTDLQCDDSDKLHCRLCHGTDNCNFVGLASNDIGYPGNWQGVPINCYTCKNEECAKRVLIQACEGNINQNCATVFAANGTVVQRGCSDLIYSGENSNYCDVNPGNCKFCKSNGCNLAKSLSDFGDCLFCDGVDNTDCIFHPENITRVRSCYKGCITGLYPRKFEENPAYELTRSCWDDLDLDDREDCKAGTKPYCRFCYEASCNTAKLPRSRRKCNTCNDTDCDYPKSIECTAFRENDHCFTLFVDENNVERMGCASDLDNSELEEFARQLLLCNSDNCNTFESFPTPTLCRSCNSIDDPNCVSNPKLSNATNCHIFPHTKCYTRVDESGATHRGCLSDVDDSDVFADCASGNSSSCEVCATTNCNANIYPEGRRSCIQCTSDAFAACDGNPKGFAKVCSLYDENESCVTKLEGNRIIRGCASEFSCNASSFSTCHICNTTDNCNTVNLLPLYVGEPGKWQELPLSCYHCEGGDCAIGNGTLSQCEGNNLQTCMTVFNAKGVVVQLGCSDTVIKTSAEYCLENGDKCLACKSNACNTAKSLDDYVDCYFCDSSDDSTCSVDFNPLKTITRKCQKKCMAALYPRSSGNDPSYELTRTCLDDMELEDREKCTKGNKYLCESCDGSRCNTMNVVEERFECYKCSDDECEDMKPQQCSSYHENDQCYVLFNNESSIVAMGCRSEFEMHVVNELVKKKQMRLCNAKNCNAPETLPTPKLCSVCNSLKDPLCATNPNLVNNFQRCTSLPYSECFTRINAHGHTERGCLGSLEEDEFYGCLLNTYGLCETCVGDKCNGIDVYPENRRKCQQCSSANDAKCASTPNSNKFCTLHKEYDYCVTNFRDGVTTRGCRSDMKCDDESDPLTCRICGNSGCNIINIEKVVENGIPGRWQDIPITCYTCKNEEECSRSYLRPCENNPFQNCMTIFNLNGKVVQRGCSDVVEVEMQLYCHKNPEKCLRCNSNGCNEATSLDQYVECSYCDTGDDSNCVSNITAIKGTRLCHKFCMTALFPRIKEENPSYELSRSCYDDMDVDDREACKADTKAHCKVCNTANCNVIDLPDKRHSCYICEGNECRDVKAQKCPTYRPEDKCFTRFDERNEVVAFGCRSQFSNAEADYLLKKQRLHLCVGENCNSRDNIPSEKTCALCNSRTDKNCAANPAAVTGETNCAVKPFTSCYTRVLGDGATERGCLSNLYDDEFLGCLNGTSATCKSCNGNHCNKDVFPESRLKCHVCDSGSNSRCEDIPDSLSICSIYDPKDTCVTAFRNNVTYRDCSSNLVCDVTDPKTCQICSGDGCNMAILAPHVDDNFGMWQDLPLTCLSCLDDDCNSDETTISLTCELNNQQDCVTVFSDIGKVIARGCSDSIKSRYCSGNGESCYNCKSNKCNWASSKSDYSECIYCNSYDDQDCVWNPLKVAHKRRECHGGCMTALYPSYNSINSSYELIRTCLNDKEQLDQGNCSANMDRYCSACSDKNCNTNSVPKNRLSCFACKDETCEETETKICPLYKENDACFIKFDDENGISDVGCISSFRNQDLESIIKTKRVYTCLESNCNSLDKLPKIQSCAVCDSAHDVSCAVNPTGISTLKTCSILPYTNCYSKLTESGRTIRGCLADLPVDDFVACVLGDDKNCGICSGSACNREIFPADRQQCFTCTSTEESNCDSFPTTKRPCPFVSDTESCVTALSGNITVRGCKSFTDCDANDSTTCRSCFGSECNSIDLLNKHDDGHHGVWQELPLKCHTCEGEHCLYSLGPVVQCSRRNINQDCMTVFDDQQRVERRGCSDDVEDYRDLYCRQNPERCFKCKSNECNIVWSIEEYVECLFCDSEKEASCVLDPYDNEFKTRKCFKNCMVALRTPYVIRSCLDDMEMQLQNNCHQDDSKECAACLGDKCNNFTFPSDHLTCNICTDESCSNSISQVCELYDSNDFCFAKYENGKVNLLGCTFSQNASDIAEWSAHNKLYKCKENNCNELSRIPKEEVCISCSSKEIPDCAQGILQIIPTDTCPAPNNKCVSRIDAQGHTIRGCFSSLNATEQNCETLGTCAVCVGEKCNSQIYPANRRKCHICNSDADKNCRLSPSSLEVCPIYDANDKCVTTIDGNGVLQRGCTSEIHCSNNDNNYCNICNRDGCNTIDLRGSANTNTNSIFLTLLMAIASALMLKY